MKPPEETPFPFPPREGAMTRFPDRAPMDVPIFQMSNWWLAIECGNCGLSRYPLRLLAARLGWRKTLASLLPRLKCGSCGAPPASVQLVDTPQGEGGRHGARPKSLGLAIGPR